MSKAPYGRERPYGRLLAPRAPVVYGRLSGGAPNPCINRALPRINKHKFSLEFLQIQHILTNCVFSRQVWCILYRHSGLPDFSPHTEDNLFSNWWLRINSLSPGIFRLGLNSLVTLGSWMLCKHPNVCVFNSL